LGRVLPGKTGQSHMLCLKPDIVLSGIIMQC